MGLTSTTVNCDKATEFGEITRVMAITRFKVI